jgi:uncharacterized protein
MKTHNIFRPLVSFLLLTSILLVAGCASSPPSRFYTLDSLASSGKDGLSRETAMKNVISVGPIEIADYLDRPQVVTRSSENQIQFSEFDRWGGSLKVDINRVLVENFSTLLREDGVMAIQWKSRYSGIISLPVTIMRFDATPGKSLVLVVHWGVLAKDGKTVESVRESIIVLPLKGAGYQDVVQAMSEALGKLSNDMVPTIRVSLAKQAPANQGKPARKE